MEDSDNIERALRMFGGVCGPTCPFLKKCKQGVMAAWSNLCVQFWR